MTTFDPAVTADIFSPERGAPHISRPAARFSVGTLWEGRYKACPIDSDRYLLACYRYIELNPVRAAMVIDPRNYRWSSYANIEAIRAYLQRQQVLGTERFQSAIEAKLGRRVRPGKIGRPPKRQSVLADETPT